MKAKIVVAAVVVVVATGLATGVALSGRENGDPPPFPWETDPSITQVCMAIAAAPGEGNENGRAVDAQGRELWVWVDGANSAPPPEPPPSRSGGTDEGSRPNGGPVALADDGERLTGSPQFGIRPGEERCEPNTPPRRDGER